MRGTSRGGEMNLEPTDDELDTWAAKFLGWTPSPTFPGWWVERKGSDLIHVIPVDDFHPTRPGHEHQAMMVVRKMVKNEWVWDADGDDGHNRFTFAKGRINEYAVDPDIGRAIILAAKRAMEAQDAL